MLERFVWHHGSFGLSKVFARKLRHSKWFGQSFPFFRIDVLFFFQIPVKYQDIHWFFFVISRVTRLVYPFLGVLCCCIRWGIRFHTFFWPLLKCGFLVVFPSWRSTGSFCRTLSFQCTHVKIILGCLYFKMADSS